MKFSITYAGQDFWLWRHGFNYVIVHPFEIFYVRSLRTIFSRIHFNFQNKNMSSTFVDIANNMPCKFHLDMPRRISVMTSWVQLWLSAFFSKKFLRRKSPHFVKQNSGKFWERKWLTSFRRYRQYYARKL